LAFACLAASAACGTNTDLDDRPLFPDGFIVFQAVVLDGVDGSQIVDVDLRVQVGHHTLPSEQLEGVDGANGIHIIYGIPDNTGVFVLADAEGYAPFIAKVTIDGNGSVTTGDLDYRFFNVLMFPIGTSPSDLSVTIFTADGEPVANATVVATLNQQPTNVPVDTPLFPGVGILPSSAVATTDAAGKATFSGDNLILGGRYSISVFGALDAQGVFLVPSSATNVTIGATVPEIVIFLDRPLLTPIAISVNNEDAGIHSNLVVNFPYEVELCSLTSAHTWQNVTNQSPFFLTLDTNANGTVAQPALANPVTLTGDGTATLTLEENYGNTTAAFDGGDDLFIQFNGVTLKPRGAGDGSCRSLSTVEIRDTGSFVNPRIHVNDP
jgi:hypothetical protein